MGQAFSGLTERDQNDSNPDDNGDNTNDQNPEQTSDPSRSSSRRSNQRTRTSASTQLPYVLVPRSAVSVTRNQSQDRQIAQAANMLRMINSFRENPGQSNLTRRQNSSRANNQQEPVSRSNIPFPPLPITQGFPFQPGPSLRPRNQPPSGLTPRVPLTPNEFPPLSNPLGGSQLGAAPESENPSVLNQILTAAASAINLTTAEYQQRMDSAAANGEPSQSARTAASFMDSFLDHLQRTTNEADNPFPRLSLISESVNSDEDPNTTSIFRVFRMQQGIEDPSQPRDETARTDSQEVPAEAPETNSSMDTRPDNSFSESNLAGGQVSNEMIPVLIIGIRSIPNRPTGLPAEDANPPTETAPRTPRTRSTVARGSNEQTPAQTSEPAQANPDDSRPPVQRRSWVIYVIGSTYPATHPILTTALSDNPSYEDLLMLSTLLGPARPPTTTQEAIESQFGEVVFDEYLPGVSGIALLNGNRCQVCLCDYEPKDKLRILKCQHAYHTSCIDRWLTQGSNNCPVCRRSGTVKQTKVETQPGPPTGEEGDGTSLVGLLHDPPRN